VLQKMRERKAIDDDIEKDLTTSLKDFVDSWVKKAATAAA